MHAARRPEVLPFLAVRLLSLSLAVSSPPSTVTGIVVDQAGRPVPRAIVQVVGPDGAAAATTLTDADGVFRVTGAPASCRVEAALTGFSKASGACDDANPL